MWIHSRLVAATTCAVRVAGSMSEYRIFAEPALRTAGAFSFFSLLSAFWKSFPLRPMRHTSYEWEATEQSHFSLKSKVAKKTMTRLSEESEYWQMCQGHRAARFFALPLQPGFWWFRKIVTRVLRRTHALLRTLLRGSNALVLCESATLHYFVHDVCGK